MKDYMRPHRDAVTSLSLGEGTTVLQQAPWLSRWLIYPGWWLNWWYTSEKKKKSLSIGMMTLPYGKRKKHVPNNQAVSDLAHQFAKGATVCGDDSIRFMLRSIFQVSLIISGAVSQHKRCVIQARHLLSKRAGNWIKRNKIGPNSYSNWLTQVHFRYPLVMTSIANWKITIFNGKLHYFYGHFQ